MSLGSSSVLDMIQAAYAARTLYVLTRIGVFEALSDAPMALDELSQACGTRADILADLLRLAVALKFVRMEGGKYRIAKKSLRLVESTGAWLRSYLLVWGGQIDPAFAHLEEYVRTGNNAFKAAHGLTIWDYYRAHPDQNELFVSFMQGVTQHEHLAPIVSELDVGSAESMVDVAGGTGALACALATRYPSMSCVVCDQPSNAAAAQRYIGALANCAFEAANIFSAVPAWRDLYTIKHVLHDWDDANAAQIVRTIAKAMRQDSRLVILEGLLDRDFPADFENPEYLHTRSIEQRAWTPGRVRSSEDFKAMAAAAGLTVTRITHSSRVADISYIECRYSA